MGSTLPCGEASPMEETMQALVDTLVSPLLPKFSSNRNPPAKSQEQSIGKQMHAVVLLYNYFHRKRFPEVEFLDCQAFIKAAVIAKKTLLSFVSCGQPGQKTITEKMMMEAFDICNRLNADTSLPCKDSWPVSKVSVLLVDTEKQNFLLQFGSDIHGVWSLIEKDITTTATHASGQKNLEKQTTPAKKIFRGTPQSKKASSLITLDEEALLQVAHSAVNDKTGLDSSSLMVLQSDYVASLSKVRSTTRFYLMQCSKEAGEQLKKIPIKDALNSLLSPIVAKVSDGYETTEAVTFFQLFPYVKIISDWISRENLKSVVGLENITALMDSKVQSVTSSDNSSSSLKGDRPFNVSGLCDEDSKSLSATENHATDENGRRKKKRCRSKTAKSQVDCNVENLSSPENISSHNLMENRILNETIQSHEFSNTVNCNSDPNTIGNDYGKGVKRPYGSDAPSKDSELSALLGSGENLQSVVGPENITTLMDSKVQSVTSPDNSFSSLKGDGPSSVSGLCDEDSENLSGTVNHVADKNGRGKKKRRRSKTAKIQVDCNAENLNSPENISSHNLKENKILNETIQAHEISNTVNCSSDRTAIGKSFVVAEDQVARPCCKQLEPVHNVGGTSNISENVTWNEFGTKIPPMRPQVGDMSAKPSGELGIDFSIQDELAKSNLSVLQFEDPTKKGNKLTMTLSSMGHTFLQTAVKVLEKKRAKLVHEHQKLSLKQRQVQDAIALCEKQIQTVMTGGDEASALIIETVIEGCDVAPSEEETLESYPNLGSGSLIRTRHEFLDASSEKKYAVQGNKRKRLSKAILNLYSPCQELDEICRQNNWVLPTYTVFPSKGSFVASVTVRCLDFNCSADGDVRRKPEEARDAAATCMLNKLRDMAHHM